VVIDVCFIGGQRSLPQDIHQTFYLSVFLLDGLAGLGGFEKEAAYNLESAN